MFVRYASLAKLLIPKIFDQQFHIEHLTDSPLPDTHFIAISK